MTDSIDMAKCKNNVTKNSNVLLNPCSFAENSLNTTDSHVSFYSTEKGCTYFDGTKSDGHNVIQYLVLYKVTILELKVNQVCGVYSRTVGQTRQITQLKGNESETN